MDMPLLIILIIGTATGYEFRCPAKAEWTLRANISCSSVDEYVCLFNLLETKYQNYCEGPSQSSRGSKLVFQPGLNLAKCSARRFQPIVFTTNGNSNCMMSKSTCVEEGQAVHSNGSSSNDTTCSCDYTKGYAFISKPKNSCFCIPSEEDCSCFRVKCAKLSQDYQCIADGDTFASTKCQTMYTDISYNKTMQTYWIFEYTIKGFSSASIVMYIICVLSVVYAVAAVLTVKFIALKKSTFEPVTHERSNGIEQSDREICDDDSNSSCTQDNKKQQVIHELVLGGECGKVYFARIIFIGKHGVGKTSLMRRLLWNSKEDITSTQSTDGIEINKCNINTKDGKWSPCKNIDDDLARLIHQVYRRKSLTAEQAVEDNGVLQLSASFISDESIPESDTEHSKTSDAIDICFESADSQYSDCNESVDIGIRRTNTYSCMSENMENIENNDILETDSSHNELEQLYRNQINSNTNKNNSEPVRDDNINKMTSSIMKQNLQCSKMAGDDMLASCWLWDFAGQKDFYATHQVFLSSCAIYLLVTDSLEFSTAGTQGMNFEGSAEYVSFWFDTIHCYWSTTKKGRLDPPIIVVCTNQDHIKESLERERRQNEFKTNLGQILQNQEKKNHLRNIFFVSNIEDTDIVFEKIRNEISRNAMEMQDWGKDCPLKWFLFQQVLLKLRDGNVPISSTKKLLKIAKHDSIDICEENEVKRCLQYCHDIGTVVYFDEENLADYVILEPKWLINAFRCLVSDKIDNLIEVSDDWQILNDTGRLTDALINRLFRKEPELKFEDNKAHILEVMKRFDIIVNLNNSSALYMPCMIKSCSLSKVQNYFFDGRQAFYKTSWLCLEFKFLPPAFFNHTIAWYLKQYSVSIILDKENRIKRNALYRQIGVFDLDSSAFEQLVICAGPNVIALQVWDTRMSHKTYGGLRSNLFRFVETLQKRYRIQISYTIGFQCKDGDFVINHKQIEDLIPKEYRCLEHNTIHLSEDLVQPWDFCEELKQLRKRKSQQLKSETDADEDIR